MAGHSKWANIKHRKARADAKKGKEFTRVTKEIITAVKVGGPDPEANPRLRLALQKAKVVNLPKDNIERNIKKASSADQSNYEEITYELYGHGGVGIIVEIMTDNKNRTSSDIRIATNKRGGSIASPGSVAFNFDKNSHSDVYVVRLFNQGAISHLLRMRILRRMVRDNSYDVVLLSGLFSLWAGMILKWLYPSLHTMAILHGSEVNPGSWPVRLITHQAIAQANRLLPVSRFTFGLLPQRLRQRPYTIIPNGIEITN